MNIIDPHIAWINFIRPKAISDKRNTKILSLNLSSDSCKFWKVVSLDQENICEFWIKLFLKKSKKVSSELIMLYKRITQLTKLERNEIRHT